MLVAISAGTLFLGACGEDSEGISPKRVSKSRAAAGAPASPQAPANVITSAPKPPAAAGSVLTPNGVGRLTTGMSRSEAVATGLLIAAEEEASEECEIYQLREDPDSWAMFLDGKLSRISVEGKSRTRTQAGHGLGAREAEIIATYGSAVQVEPHAYDGPEAHYLTIWTKPKKRGLRFETDAEGTVRVIHGGDQTIQFVEGCS